MRAACCWYNAGIITSFYGHEPLPWVRARCDYRGQENAAAIAPLRGTLWLHIGEVGCFAQASSPELKFTFSSWLPRTVRVPIKGLWLWNTHCFQMLVVNQALGRQGAAGDTIKAEGLESGDSDLLREWGWKLVKHLKGLFAGGPAPSSPQQGGGILRIGPNLAGKSLWVVSPIGWL